MSFIKNDEKKAMNTEQKLGGPSPSVSTSHDDDDGRAYLGEYHLSIITDNDDICGFAGARGGYRQRVLWIARKKKCKG